MAFPTSYFSAQLSMYVIKIITQTCSDIISGLQLQEWPGSCWNRPKQCWQSWHHHLLKDSSLLPPSGSSHICALVSAVWLGLPRLYADSNMCCGLGSSPEGCCPHVVTCLAVDVCRWHHLLGFAGFPAAVSMLFCHSSVTSRYTEPISLVIICFLVPLNNIRCIWQWS